MAGPITVADHLATRPFALALSSGFFGFYAHAGVTRALEDVGLRPTRLTGSSAGALIAGLWGSGVPSRAIVEELLALRRADFWDPAPGFGLLRGERFQRRVESLLGSRTFEGCRDPVAISAFDLGRGRTAILERGDLASAICASCAFPGLLQPVWRDGHLYSDGGIGDWAGLAGLRDHPPDATVLHHPLGAAPWARRDHGRPAVVTLRIRGLPRPHPFRLDAGRAAMDLAHRAARRAMALPISPVLEVAG